MGIHCNLVLSGADFQFPECQEQNVQANSFSISVVLYLRLFLKRVLIEYKILTKIYNNTYFTPLKWLNYVNNVVGAVNVCLLNNLLCNPLQPIV